jgi:hypothetical protein
MTATSAHPTPLANPIPGFRPARGNWIHSPGWDGFWMFSALWGSALLGLASLWLGLARAGALLFLINTWLALCHSWSTTYMVLGSPLFRAERRRDLRKYVLIPLGVVGGSLLLGILVAETHALPSRFPLDSGLWLWGVYLGLFWVGHFWHFGNQDFGVLSLYRLKAGQTGARDRRIDRVFATAMMFVIQPIVYLKALTSSPLAEAFYSWAPVSRESVLAAARVAVVAAVLLSAAVIAQELVKTNRSLPKLLYYLVMLTHPLLITELAFRLGFFYLIAYFWSHWFIAVGLVGRINSNYYRERGRSAPGAVFRHAASLAPILVLVAPIYAVFGSLSVFSGKDYKEVLALFGTAYPLLLGVLLGFFLAEQLLHYYCDRRLFRFREPGVRRAVAPLL